MRATASPPNRGARDRRARRFDDSGATLRDVGEERLLELLTRIARTGAAAGPDGDGSPPPRVVVPPGDDAAVWRPRPGSALALSQDALVEGRDFQRRWLTPHQLGRRAVAVALSDVAAMGARPAFCLATLCAPSSTVVDDVLAVQEGLCDRAAEAGCPVLGGDVSDIDGPLVVDVVVAGSIEENRCLRRDRGSPGDLLAVTGTLGAAAAGLRLLLGAGSAGAEVGASARRRWTAALLDPTPRLDEGLALASGGAACAGDVSDGLLADARRTASASGCAAELWLDSLPVDADLRAAFPDAWSELALGGGEDFELLVAAPASALAQIERGWAATLAPLTVVGRLVEGGGLTLRAHRSGPELPLPAVSSRHYGEGTR